MSRFDNISKGKWVSTFGINKERGIRYEGGFIAFLTKPSHYSGQDERYEQELDRSKQDAELMAFAGNLAQKYNIEVIEEVVHSLKEIDKWLRKKSLEMPVDSKDFSELVNTRKQTIEALKSIEK